MVQCAKWISICSFIQFFLLFARSFVRSCSFVCFWIHFYKFFGGYSVREALLFNFTYIINWFAQFCRRDSGILCVSIWLCVNGRTLALATEGQYTLDFCVKCRRSNGFTSTHTYFTAPRTARVLLHDAASCRSVFFFCVAINKFHSHEEFNLILDNNKLKWIKSREKNISTVSFAKKKEKKKYSSLKFAISALRCCDATIIKRTNYYY